jgi:hypothetical protein
MVEVAGRQLSTGKAAKLSQLVGGRPSLVLFKFREAGEVNSPPVVFIISFYRICVYILCKSNNT